MTGVSFSYLGKFMHFPTASMQAGKMFAPGKPLMGQHNAGNEPQAARPVRDVFSLSQQDQVTYAKHLSKPDKAAHHITTQNVQTEQANETSRIFSSASNSVDNLIQFLGLDTVDGNDLTLAGAFNLALESEGTELSGRLNDLLEQAGLGNEPNEIILAEDTEGNIIVLGDIDENKREMLAELINSDLELVGQIKDHRAKLEIAYALENDLDLDSGELAAARSQLLTSFLQREGGFSINDVAVQINQNTQAESLIQQDANGNSVLNSLLPELLSQMPGLEAELLHSLESAAKQHPLGDAGRALLAINGGVVSAADGDQQAAIGLNGDEETGWMIADGAEALVGHDILDWLEKGMLAKSGGKVNEYGFFIGIPGVYDGVSYLTVNGAFESNPQRLHADVFCGKTGKPVEKGRWAPHIPSDNDVMKRVSIPGILHGVPNGGLGNQTFEPEIHFTDALGLGGMNFADRKLFLASVQSIIDNVIPDMGVDARQFTYSTDYLSDADYKDKKLSLTIRGGTGLSDEQRHTLVQALNQNRQLAEMKHRADTSGSRGFGEFTMSVLDVQGNALAKDQVRLIAGDKSVITSLGAIKNMDQQQIFSFINRH